MISSFAILLRRHHYILVLWRIRSNVSRHCDVFSDASIGHILLWWKDIFKVSFIHTCVCFFPYERFDSANKVVRKRFVLKRVHLHFEEKLPPWSLEILCKWTTARLFLTTLTHRKKKSVALSRSTYVVLRLTNF